VVVGLDDRRMDTEVLRDGVTHEILYVVVHDGTLRKMGVPLP
jgi:hypothetical protein